MQAALTDVCAKQNLQPTEYFFLKVRTRVLAQAEGRGRGETHTLVTRGGWGGMGENTVIRVLEGRALCGF